MSSSMNGTEPAIYTTPASQQGTSSPQFTHSSIFQAIFLKGKPKILGIVLIVTAVLQIALGIASYFTSVSANFVSGLPFWGPVFYMAAGFLTLIAHAKLDLCMVKAAVILNICSVIFSFISVILVSVDLYVITNMADYEHYFTTTRAAGCFVLAMLLITNLVMCGVGLTGSVFGCWAVNLSPAPHMFTVGGAKI